MDDVTLHLRNLRSREWTRYTPEEWLDRYYDFVEHNLCCWRDTVGGSIGITGTPEQGRLTVCDVDGTVVRDYDWRTTVTESSVSEAVHRWP